MLVPRRVNLQTNLLFFKNNKVSPGHFPSPSPSPYLDPLSRLPGKFDSTDPAGDVGWQFLAILYICSIENINHFKLKYLAYHVYIAFNCKNKSIKIVITLYKF